MPAVEPHERRLVDHAMRRLSDIEGLSLLGRAQDRGGEVVERCHAPSACVDANGFLVAHARIQPEALAALNDELAAGAA